MSAHSNLILSKVTVHTKSGLKFRFNLFLEGKEVCEVSSGVILQFDANDSEEDNNAQSKLNIAQKLQ